MRNLHAQLLALDLQSSLWIGVGNSAYADDAAGIVLAQLLLDSHLPHVAIAGANPERWICATDGIRWPNVIFLDAVELGAEPGSAVFLGADAMVAQFPQVTTHKLSLGLLARYVEAQSNARAWLLGIQPHSLRPFGIPTATLDTPVLLSPVVQFTVKLLHQLIVECFQSQACPAVPSQ
jgi:hydrogenase maturation protease